MATNRNTKRKDKARVVLRKGESQRKDGKYDFRWTSPDGKRHSIYAATLEELREKENDIQRDSLEGIKAEARYVSFHRTAFSPQWVFQLVGVRRIGCFCILSPAI